MLQRVLKMVTSWPVDVVAVVIGAYEEEVLEAVDFGDSLLVLNPEWKDGMASSIRAGLDALSADTSIERAFLALGDQPRIPDDIPTTLLEAMDRSERPVALARYRYTTSNPALVDRSLWPRLMSRAGDRGASQLFEAHPAWVEEVQVDYPPPRDVDTEDDALDLLSTP